MNKTYIIQKIRTKTNKKMILVFDFEGGLMATKEYNFNLHDEAIKPLKLDNVDLMVIYLKKDLVVQGNEFNHLKKRENLIK